MRSYLRGGLSRFSSPAWRSTLTLGSVASFLVLGAQACANQGSGGPVAQIQATTCSTDADCAANQTCSGQVCTCSTDQDCSNGDACVGGLCSCTADTWDNYASGFFTSNCSSCHDFAKTYSSVAGQQESIQQEIDSTSMPQGGKLDQAEIDRMDRWISCGMPQ